MSLSTEQKVGLFFLFALIMLGVMIELVEDWKPFETQYDYVALFNSSVGLKVGDPVRIAGVEAGKVRNIGIENNQVRVDFYVDEKADIKSDSVASIRQTNLLGGTFLGLEFGSPASKSLPPGSVVPTRESSNFDELITNLDKNQERVFGSLGNLINENGEPLADAIVRLERIMSKIDEGSGTLGQLVNNPELFNRMASTSRRLDQFLAQVEAGEGTLGKLATNGELYDRFNVTMENLQYISEKLKNGEGTLGRLLEDESLYRETATTLSGLRDITEKINNGQGTLGKLVNDETLYHDLREGIGRINSIAAKIDKGQGTLGRLVNEDALYRDAETTLHKVEKAVDGVSDTGPLSALGIVLGTLF